MLIMFSVLLALGGVVAENPQSQNKLLSLITFYSGRWGVRKDPKTITSRMEQSASTTGTVPEVKFLYVLSRQKDPWLWLDLEDSSYFLESFKQTVCQMEKFLRLSSNAHDLIAALPYDPDSFYWNDAQEIATKFYG